MSEIEAEKIVFDFIESKLRRNHTEFALLSDREKTISLVYIFELEVSNGGIEQFFINPSGDSWRETLRALQDIQATRIINIFERALAVFPTNTPSIVQGERLIQYEEAVTKAEQILDELTDEYFNLYERFPTEDSYYRMATYLKEGE